MSENSRFENKVQILIETGCVANFFMKASEKIEVDNLMRQRNEALGSLPEIAQRLGIVLEHPDMVATEISCYLNPGGAKALKKWGELRSSAE